MSNPYLDALKSTSMATGADTPSNPYLNMLQEDEAARKARKARQAAQLSQAVKVNPEQYNTQRRVAQYLGYPVAAVETLPELADQAKVQQIQRDTASSPVLQRKYSEADFAKLAHDDSGTLAKLYDWSKGAGSQLLGSLHSGALSLVGVGATVIDALNPFTLSPSDAAVLFKDDPAKLRDVLQNSPATALSRVSRAMQEGSQAVAKDVNPQAQEAYGNLKYATLNPSEAAYLSPVKVTSDALQSLPTTLALAFSAYFTRGQSIKAYETAVAGGATAEAALATAVKTGSMTMARTSAASEGVVGAAQQFNQVEMETLQANLSKSPRYAELIAQGYSPEAAREVVAGSVATQAGQIAGIVDSVTNYVGGKYLGKIISEGGTLVPRVLKGAVQEGVTEFVQSMGEQFGQNWAEQMGIDPNTSLIKDVLESGIQGLVVGGLTGGGFAAAFGRVTRDQQQIAQSQADADRLQQALQTAGQSLLRERSPEQFRAVMAEMTDGNVYVDGQVLNQLAPEVLNQLPESVREQIATAAAIGDSVEIPVADVLTIAPGTPLEQVIVENARTDPFAMSKADAEAAAKMMQSDVVQNSQRIIQQAQDQEAARQKFETVRQGIEDQLNATGRFRKQVNYFKSFWLASFYNSYGTRSGMGIEEFSQKYFLRILGAPVGQQTGVLNAGGATLRTVNVGDTVDGRVVRDGVPNLESIGSSLDNYEVLPGVREVPISAFDAEYVSGISMDRLDERTRKLAEDIRASGEITPLIVVQDAQGMYVLEGGHRLDALIASGAQSLPAVVVIDQDNPPGQVLNAGMTLADVTAQWDSQGIRSSVSEKGGVITLSQIVVPEGQRSQGLGSQAMQALVDYADSTGQRIALSPSADFGGNKKRLMEFYKRFGFVENKGRNKDFSVSETMIREPQQVLEQRVEPLTENDADRAASLNAARVSPRMPTGVKATENGFGETRLQPTIAAMPESMVEKTAAEFLKYPNFAGLKGTPREILEQAKQHMKDNLRALVDAFPADLRERARMWYVGGNRIARALSEIYGVPPENVALAIAALSPQKNWFENVTGAERVIDIVVTKSEIPWSAEMTAVANARGWFLDKTISQHVKDVEGKTLRQMYDPADPDSFVRMAWWVRAYDEAHNPRELSVITPEGTFTDQLFSARADGAPTPLRWGSAGEIGKAIAALVARTPEARSKIAGGAHKVRSFFNNIIAPYAGEDVTIDTHAVAAALLRPLGGTTPEVQNVLSGGVSKEDAAKGYAGIGGSSITGSTGSYGVYADAYRELAAELNILPRELQSITWEAVRLLYDTKGATLKRDVADVWSRVSNGELTHEQAIKLIFELAGGIGRPDWSSAEARPQPLDSSYRRAPDQPAAGAAEGEGRQAAAGSLPGVLNQSGFDRFVGDATRVDLGDAHEFKAGEPVVVAALHGTTGEFTAFDPAMANIESDLGGGFYFTNNPADVGENYAGMGPDLTNKIQGEAERLESNEDLDPDEAKRIARDKWMANDGLTIPVWVKMRNPAVLGGSRETFLSYEENYNEELDEYGEPTGDLIKLTDALRDIAGDERYGDFDAERVIADVMERAIDNGGLTAREFIEVAGLSEGLVYAADYEADGKLASKEILRLAFEAAGFDGFIDQTVDEKFGSASERQRKYGKGMKGMDADTVHFIAFKPTQIKSRLGNSGAFDETDPDILKQGPRGTFNPQTLELVLNPNADLSTWFHETGHFFLEVLADVASQPDAPAQIAEDMNRVLAWFGIKGDETVGGADSGMPLEQQAGAVRLYHGSKQPIQGRFRASGKSVNTTTFGDVDTERTGVFFSDNPEFSAEYGEVAAYDVNIESTAVVTRDLVLDFAETIDPFGPDRELYLLAKNTSSWGMFDGEVGRRFVAYLREQGYDSATFQEDLVTEDGRNVESNTTVVFDPERISAATLAQGDQPTAPSAQPLPQRRTPLEVWNAMTLDQKRPYHERWAESIEQYVMEGKAPSVELQGVMRRFAAWIKDAYKRVLGSWQKFIDKQTGDPITLNDDIRRVMDRMLATDEQIAQANEVAGLMPDEQADGEAAERLQKRSMADLKWQVKARDAAIAKLKREAKAIEKQVREEVTAEVDATPEMRAKKALDALQITPEYEGLVRQHAEERAAVARTERDRLVAELYAANPDVTGLKRGQLLAKNKREIANKVDAYMIAWDKSNPKPSRPMNINDADLATVADSFGFESVPAMLEAISVFGSRQEAIDGMTERRMLEEHGDLIDERAITEAANEAVHNEARARSLATELRTQREMLGARTDTGEVNARGARITVNALVEAAKQFGANVISRTPLKDLRSTAWKHTAAERRAGKRWAEATAAGKTEDAVKAKQDQMLNNAAAKAALDAAAEAKKIVEFFRRVTKGNDEKVVEKGRDPDIVNAARAVLAAYGVETSTTKGAQDYLDVLQRNDPDTYAAVQPMMAIAMQNAQPLEALTFEELQGLHESIQAMWHLAKRSRQMEVDGDMLDIDDVADELFARMEQIGIPDRVAGEGMAVTKEEERGLFLKQGIAFLRRVEQWAEGMDGKYGGPFLRFIFQPIKDAADRYRKDRIAYRKKFQALVDNLAPIVGDSVIAAPELNYTFGTPGSTAGTAMNEILHAIAHTGNDSNKRKLLLGRGWATENPDGTLDTRRWDQFIRRLVNEGKLQKEHFDFVQGVWDLLEETKPLAQKAHRDAFGRYFSEVTANEFVDPFGVTRRGGYVPAQVDSRLVKDNALRKLAEEQNNSMAYAFPQPAKGFTMARTEYNRPLMLDLRTLSQHLDKVLLFSHMTVPARDVRKLITRKNVSQPLDRIQPAAIESMLQPWLQRSAQQIVETPIVGSGKWARLPGIIRARAGAALMFANVSNAIQQVTGLSTAMIKVGPGHMMRALAQHVAHPVESARAVWALSPYMDDRAKNEVAVMNEQMQAILINPSVYEKVQDWSMRHAYFLQTAIDNALSPIIWTGAYNQALAEGMSDVDAVRFADGTVRQTQGSTLPEDVSRFETGPAYARAFTQFISYFNMVANTNGTALKQVASEVGLKKGAGRAFSVVMLGLLVPIWVAEAIALAFKGGPDDEDKDGVLIDDWLAAVFGFGTAKGLLAMIPIFGQAANSAVTRLDNNPMNDRISLSPGVSLLESALGGNVQTVYELLSEDKEVNARRAVRDAATLVSVFTGVPVYAVARPAGYAAGVAQGKIEPTSEVDMARGLITGTASPESKVR